MSLKHCKSHQLPIQKLVLVRLDTMLDLLANSPASVAAFAMRVWGCKCGGVGCEGCGGCRGMPGEALLGPDTFSHFPLLPTHPPTQHGCSNSSSRNQPNGCAASEPQNHRQHGMCTMAPRGAEKKWLTTRHWSTSSHSKASVCNSSWAWPRQSVPRGTVMPLASGQPDSGWAAAAAESCHHWRRGQLWHWPMTMRKQQHGTLLGVTWPFTKSLGPRRRRGRDLVGLVLDRGWWYCWGIHWTVAT